MPTRAKPESAKLKTRIWKEWSSSIGATYADIARRCGVSGEYVRQVVRWNTPHGKVPRSDAYFDPNEEGA